MSFVTTQPEMLAAAVAHLQSIGSAMSVQNAAAAAPITGVVPAAADEVSALTAARLDEPIRIMVFCDSCGWEARASVNYNVTGVVPALFEAPLPGARPRHVSRKFNATESISSRTDGIFAGVLTKGGRFDRNHARPSSPG